MDADHWVLWHLRDECDMKRINMNPFAIIIVVFCGVVVDVDVNFIRALNGRVKCFGCCSCGKMSG